MNPPSKKDESKYLRDEFKDLLKYDIDNDTRIALEESLRNENLNYSTSYDSESDYQYESEYDSESELVIETCA